MQNAINAAEILFPLSTEKQQADFSWLGFGAINYLQRPPHYNKMDKPHTLT
jgi:hypothetical protein